MTTKDVAIIGGGVIGCLIARELARYAVSVVVLETHGDVACATSKANSSIVHAGFDAKLGSNKARFNVPGNAMMEDVCKELHVDFKQNGSMVLAFDEIQMQTVQEIYQRGVQNGVPDLEILDGDALRALEPTISHEVKGGLLAKSGGIVCPYKLTHHAAENAARNGVQFMFHAEVKGIVKNAEGLFVLETGQGTVQARFLVNAAGVYADRIARLAGDDTMHIYPRVGEYMLLDKKSGSTVSHTIFQVPTNMGKGILITPTVDGNLLIGPTARNKEDKTNVATSDAGLAEVLAGAVKSIPSLSKKDVITSFAGLRAIAHTDDFIIGNSDVVENLVHAAGIQSPGLSSAPAIAVFVAEQIAERCGGLALNTSFNPILEPRPAVVHMSHAELSALIQSNPQYGNIICRCETVSAGEILDAVHDCCGAKDLDGVKRRTRAGMGRCQGGFCMPKVLEILSVALQRSFTDITKNDDGSFVLVGRTKGGVWDERN